MLASVTFIVNLLVDAVGRGRRVKAFDTQVVCQAVSGSRCIVTRTGRRLSPPTNDVSTHPGSPASEKVSTLASSSRIVLPVMADDSSRRAIQNAFSLVYGLKLPSEIYAAYMFSAKLKEAGRNLPQVHLIVKNRITQYMGSASAYGAVLKAIESDVGNLLKTNPELFSFQEITQGFVDIRDFQTTGVVAFAKGQPFSCVRPGKQSINGQRVQVAQNYLDNCVEALEVLAKAL